MECCQVPPQQARLEVQTLMSGEFLQSLLLLRDILKSSVGPHGKIKSIQNTVGGHITMTTTAGRLLPAVSVSQPALRLLVNAVHAGLKPMRDGGLRAGLLATSLLLTSLSESEAQVPFRILTSLYDECLACSLKYLELQNHVCNVDSLNVATLSLVTRSILTSKPFCCLFKETLATMTNLVVKSFLGSLLCSNFRATKSDGVFLIGSDQRDTSYSAYFRGLLLECPQLSTLKEKVLGVVRSDGGRIKVALLTTSAAGDAEWAIDGRYELDPSLNMTAVVISQLRRLVQQLVKEKVGLVLSQRVVHPEIKVYLSREQVLCVDRLGAAVIPYVVDLTDASSLGLELSDSEVQANIGYLDCVSHKILFGKSFLHLQCSESTVNTLVITSPWEERTEELKAAVRCALTSLQRVFHSQGLLPGGGCWVTQMRAYVQELVSSQVESLMAKYGCTKPQVLWTVSKYTNCLQQLAMAGSSDQNASFVDTRFHHHWSVPQKTDLFTHSADLQSVHCSCGMVRYDMVEDFAALIPGNAAMTGLSCKSPVVISSIVDGVSKAHVLDSVDVAKFVLTTAVQLTHTFMNISQCITDTN